MDWGFFLLFSLVCLAVGLPVFIIGLAFIVDPDKAKKVTFIGALLLIPQAVSVIMLIFILLVREQPPVI